MGWPHTLHVSPHGGLFLCHFCTGPGGSVTEPHGRAEERGFRGWPLEVSSCVLVRRDLWPWLPQQLSSSRAPGRVSCVCVWCVCGYPQAAHSLTVTATVVVMGQAIVSPNQAQSENSRLGLPLEPGYPPAPTQPGGRGPLSCLHWLLSWVPGQPCNPARSSSLIRKPGRSSSSILSI